MTQISPISAAQHYATSARFWEDQAKLLRHELDTANARIVELERQAASEADDPADGTATMG